MPTCCGTLPATLWRPVESIRAPCGLLAERNGISPKPAGALQCNSLLVKEAQQHHGPVERDEQVCIGGEGGERPGYRAVWREVVAMAHLKARDHGEALVYPSAGHALTPERLYLL